MPTAPASPTPPQHESWFIVRKFSVDASREHEDLSAGNDLLSALAVAQQIAHDTRYRQIVLTDLNGMCWATFNMIWSGIR